MIVKILENFYRMIEIGYYWATFDKFSEAKYNQIDMWKARRKISHFGKQLKVWNYRKSIYDDFLANNKVA